VVDNNLGALFLEFVVGAEAPGGGDGDHVGVDGGFDVDGGVAEEGGVLGRGV